MTALADILPHIAGLAVLLGFSAFFSGAETALFSLTRTEVRRMRHGTPGERIAARLLQEPQHLLAALLVGNLLVNILLASIIASLFHRLFGDHGVGAAVLLSTFLLLIFGEVTPKTVAARHAHIYARTAAIPLWIFSRIITPVRHLLGAVTTAVLRLFGLSDVKSWGTMTHDDLRAALSVSEMHGVTRKSERDVAERILEFQSIEARDLMVPRPDIDAVEDCVTVRDAFAKACRERREHVPVYHEDLDDIWGVLNVARLPAWRGRPEMDRPLADFRAPPGGTVAARPRPVDAVAVVPESAGLDIVLHRLQEQRTELAVVVDEFGGTSGVLSLDDILSELMGRLPGRANGAVRTQVRQVGEALVADGRTSIRLLNRDLPIPISDETADTIGGYVTALVGRLPRPGDTVEDADYRFTVLRMAGRRVGAVRIERRSPEEEETEDRS